MSASASAEAFTVRPATPQDARELARMRADSSFERKGGDAALRDAHERACAAFFARELGEPRSFLRSWIATARDRVVGGASLVLVPTLPRYGAPPSGGCDGRVRDVYVEPAHRRRGIVRALMLAVMDRARTERVDRLTLGASDMGRPLYLALGFASKSDEMVYEG